MNTISNLTNKKNKLIADATQLVTRGLKTPESKEEYRKLLAETDETQETIDMLSRIERTMPNLPAPVPVIPMVTVESTEQRRAKLNGAWRSFLAGRLDQRIAEHRAILTTTSGSDGATLVPQEFNGFVSSTLKYYAPLTQYVRTRFSSDGRPVKVAKVDDTANGLTLVVEGSGTIVVEADPSFNSVLVSTDLFSAGQIRYSNELRDDSAFDLEVFLSNLAAIRYGRGVEAILTRGVDSGGTATPNNPGLLNLATVATTTATLAAGVAFTDLVKLFDSIDAAYLPRATWLMTSKTRNSLLTWSDSTGRPFLVPAPTADGLDMLLGKPIVINQSLPQLGTANATPILFGSLWDGLEMISSELRVTNLVERYADTFSSAIIPSTRVGSTSLAPNAIKALKLAAA